ncbi:HAD family phosphatase [Altererythrobacter sp.]|nr:HAD family phosphatase [Altererythrobacter sp.]
MNDTTDAVKAVVFDVGRVIVQWQLRHLFAKIISDPAELDWFLAHVVTESWHFQHDAGRALADMVPERKRLFPQYADHLDAYATRFVETVPGRVPGTAELIEALAAKDVPLFAITNFGDEFWDQFLLTEPVLDHMRDIVVSGVERVAKPDPRIFRIAQKRFGFAPEEMLFIDDNQANVNGAAALGWQVHHFRDAEALEADLAQRGLI